MKKEFLTPSMDIASFNVENVVTASGETGVTNESAVSEALNSAMSDKNTYGNIAKIELTW